MIKVIVLKDAEASKGTCFAKAIVENNGFEIEIGVGFIKKAKGVAVAKDTVAFELPDVYLGKLVVEVRTFTVEETGEVKSIPTIVIK